MLPSISRKASLIYEVSKNHLDMDIALLVLPETKGLVEDLLVQLLTALAAKTKVVNLWEIRSVENCGSGARNTDHEIIA